MITYKNNNLYFYYEYKLSKIKQKLIKKPIKIIELNKKLVSSYSIIIIKTKT